jgi:hypothetical protein
LTAVAAAYPTAKSDIRAAARRYSNPDRLTNAIDELQKLVRQKGKVTMAKEIGEHFEPTRCTSHSFKVLLSGLKKWSET